MEVQKVKDINKTRVKQTRLSFRQYAAGPGRLKDSKLTELGKKDEGREPKHGSN